MSHLNSTIFNFVIFNGDCVPVHQANISVFNAAFFSSFGVYETVKVDRGRPFYLADHLQRLLQSAQMIDLDLNVKVNALTGWFQQLVQIDPQATWSLKIIALGALGHNDHPIIAMQPTALPTYPATYYQTGASAILYEGHRMMPTCKSLNTLVNFLARRTAQQANVVEGLLHHNGYLTEGARTNLFAVQDGAILTPPTGQVLSGITRDVILQVMAETDQPVIQAPITTDLSQVDEFFISSTSMHVMPITEIDGQTISSGQVGPVTQQVMARFDAHYRAYMASANQPDY